MLLGQVGAPLGLTTIVPQAPSGLSNEPRGASE